MNLHLLQSSKSKSLIFLKRLCIDIHPTIHYLTCFILSGVHMVQSLAPAHRGLHMHISDCERKTNYPKKKTGTWRQHAQSAWDANH